ncbi:MAG: CoA pyrophosphatase [Thermodesulfobacteriota bacterium]|nr:CoA pyrophosphatase [Thermodesulfobacteriota bacterium]
MVEKVKKILDKRESKILKDDKRKSSAVLIPLFEKDNKIHLLFTKRNSTVTFHKGQICFPGGASDLKDSSLEETALRETEEEIGVLPEDVLILGRLDDRYTLTSNFIISPFVGKIQYPYPFKINYQEIDKILEVPLSRLVEENNNSIDNSYYYNGEEIWGATAIILTQFLYIIRGEKVWT